MNGTEFFDTITEIPLKGIVTMVDEFGQGLIQDPETAIIYSFNSKSLGGNFVKLKMHWHFVAKGTEVMRFIKRII